VNSSTPRTLKLLTACTLTYMATALIAGLVAISRNQPAALGGYHSELTVTQEFLYGMGTAISPPIYSIFIQAILLMLAYRMNRWGTVGVLGLALLGLMSFLGAISEPINRRIFNPATFDPLPALLMGAMILLPLAILALGIMEWSRRRQERREHASHFNS
jgi:hypothetical protein